VIYVVIYYTSVLKYHRWINQWMEDSFLLLLPNTEMESGILINGIHAIPLSTLTSHLSPLMCLIMNSKWVYYWWF